MLADTKVYYKPQDNTIHIMCHHQGIFYDKNNKLIEGHKLSPRYTVYTWDDKIVDKNIIPIFAYGTWQLPENCWKGGFEKDVKDNLMLQNATYRKWWINYRNNLVKKYPDILNAKIVKE